MNNTQKIILRAFKFENPDIKKSSNDVFNSISTVLNENFTVSTRKMYLNQDDPNKENDSLSYYEFINNRKHLVATLLRSSEEDTQPKIDKSLFDQTKFNINDLKKSSVDTGILYKDHFYIAVSKTHLVTNLKVTSPKRIQIYINYLTNSSGCLLTPVLQKHKEIPFEEVKTITLNDCPIIYPHDSKKTETDDDNREVKKKISINPKQISSLLKSTLNYNEDVKKLSDEDLIEMVSVQLILGFKKPKDITQEEHSQRMAELTLRYIDDASDMEVRGKNRKRLSGDKLLKIKEVTIEKTDQGDIIEQDLYQEMANFLTELENEKTL